MNLIAFSHSRNCVNTQYAALSGAMSYILRGRNSKFGVYMHLGMVESHILFSGHCDLDLCPSFNNNNCVRSISLINLRQSRRDIVLASSVRPSFRPSVLSVHTFCLSGTISQYLLVRFDSFLVQMISTMDSRYPINFVKIDSIPLELLPLFKYRQL